MDAFPAPLRRADGADVGERPVHRVAPIRSPKYDWDVKPLVGGRMVRWQPGAPPPEMITCVKANKRNFASTPGTLSHVGLMLNKAVGWTCSTSATRAARGAAGRDGRQVQFMFDGLFAVGAQHQAGKLCLSLSARSSGRTALPDAHAGRSLSRHDAHRGWVWGHP